jgi:methyltransferase (TIGR00027 family)
VSATALMTALIRGVHSRREPAPLFDDPYAERLISQADRDLLFERFLMMLGDEQRARIRALPDAAQALDSAVEANPAYGGVVVRSRWSEDRLSQAVAAGVRQYVIVGAGFDTFALRRPAAAAAVQVFEIDTAETLAVKRERLAAAGLVLASNAYQLAANLESDTLRTVLAGAPYVPEQVSFVACLGVLPYLTDSGVRRLLGDIAAATCPGSAVVFDYLEPEAGTPDADPSLHRVRRELAASGNESWRSGLDPLALPQQLAAVDLELVEHLSGAVLESRFAAGRSLRLPPRMHACLARVSTVRSLRE